MLACVRARAATAPVCHYVQEHWPGLFKASAAELYAFAMQRPATRISPGGVPYMERFFLAEVEETFAYLHRFVNADAGDRNLHNHPWDEAYSRILCGRYTQQVIRNNAAGEPQVVREVLEAGRDHAIAHNTYHQIVSVDAGTWTFFAHTGWRHQWGFLEGHPILAPRFRQHVSRSVNPRWWRDPLMGADIGCLPPMAGEIPLSIGHEQNA